MWYVCLWVFFLWVTQITKHCELWACWEQMPVLEPHIKADFCVVRLCYTWVFFCFLHVFPNHQPNGIKPIFSIYLHLECITHPTFSHFLPTTILLLYLCTSQVDFFHYCASTETKRPSEPNSTHRWFGCLLLNASHSRPKALTPSLYTKKKQLTMK